MLFRVCLSLMKQVATGHLGNLPLLPYTTLPVPGPSCPKLPWDNHGTQQDILLTFFSKMVADASDFVKE